MPVALTDNQALIEQYYRAEYSDMVFFASRVLQSESMAEVAVQETFIIAQRNVDKLKSSPKPVGWLYNTLKNVIKHIRRDERIQLMRVVSLEEIPEQESAGKSTDLWLLMESCGDEDAKLLTEFYLQKRSLIELAGEYGISVGACKMRIKRARERARQK